MRFSRAFIPTLKEAPAEATAPSHVLLVRAGFIRQLGAGLYSLLPPARRVQLKIQRIIREEMERIGAQEFLLPALHPREVWEQSGRWAVMGENMFRLKDRKGGDYCLGMTHEEIFTAIARGELRSYRQLPQIWYQLQTKFRDEVRPKSGVLRVREFTMKDSYSFDADAAGLDASFEKHREAYQRIFRRCGLDFIMVEAHSGAMGGSASTEFMVRTDAGEDDVAHCASCQYAANTEKASSRGPAEAADPAPAAERLPEPRLFPTPGVRTIEDLARPPFSRSARRQLKTLVYAADGKLVLAVVRGDDDLNEAKLQTATGAAVLRPAHPDEIHEALGARPGSLGAVGVKQLPVFLERTLDGLSGMVTGANRDGFHLEGVEVVRDIQYKAADLRTVRAGEPCPQCPGKLDVFKALEVGHIFKLGTKYSESMGARYLDAEGREAPIVMGSYGIGVERIMAGAIELHHDGDGIRWPVSIAPYQVALLALQTQDASVRGAADRLHEELAAAGVAVLYDDRDERPGVKFKDADLVGLPLRIAVGKKGLADGRVEWKLRGAKDVELVPLADVVDRAKRFVNDEIERLGMPPHLAAP